jgi:hypothetical protein
MKVKVWECTDRFSGPVRAKDIVGIIERVGDHVESRWVAGQDVPVNGACYLLGGRDSIGHVLQSNNANFVNTATGKLNAIYVRLSPGFGKKMVTLVGILDDGFYTNLVARSDGGWDRLDTGRSTSRTMSFLDLAKAMRGHDARIVEGIIKVTGVS